MKKLFLATAFLVVGFSAGSLANASQAAIRPNAVQVKLCALKKTGAVRYTTASCKSTEKSVALESEFLKWDFNEQLFKSLVPTLKTKKIAIDYLGIPSSSGSTPFCGSTATSNDASGNSLDSSYGYWIFGAGITPPSSMFNLKIDPLVLANGMNWKQVAKCRLEVTVVVPG
jgi:hypothetical protein